MREKSFCGPEKASLAGEKTFYGAEKVSLMREKTFSGAQASNAREKGQKQGGSPSR